MNVFHGTHVCAFLLDIYLGVELQGDRLCLHSNLADNVKKLSKVIVPIYTSTDSGELSRCSTSLPILCVISLLHFTYSSGYLEVFHFGLNCIFFFDE